MFNPITAKFDLVNPKNFSFETIATDKTICIPVNQEMIVAGIIDIQGILDVKGTLFILNINPDRNEIILEISSDITIDAKPNIVLSNANSNDVEVTLPLASSGTKKFFIKRTDGNWDNSMSIIGLGAELIEQEDSLLLDPYDSVTLISDLTEWWVI